MASNKITEKEQVQALKAAASVLITQLETVDGEEVESLRRATLEVLAAALRLRGPKTVGGHRVQRDCYSAWLLLHAHDETGTDRDACLKDYKRFLASQGHLVSKILREGDHTGNFGLGDFLKRA